MDGAGSLPGLGAGMKRTSSCPSIVESNYVRIRARARIPLHIRVVSAASPPPPPPPLVCERRARVTPCVVAPQGAMPNAGMFTQGIYNPMSQAAIRLVDLAYSPVCKKEASVQRCGGCSPAPASDLSSLAARQVRSLPQATIHTPHAMCAQIYDADADAASDDADLHGVSSSLCKPRSLVP